jgi:CRISPR system Cascade subunit CasA
MAECDLLVEPIFSVRIGEGLSEQTTLPGVLSRLGAKRDVFFDALQPHQQHAWYALLVHLGALSLRALGKKEPAQSEDVYRDGLRKLSGLPQWWLVDSHDKPAFLQSPTDGCIVDARNRLLTPDEMDMIPCAANHSRKRRRIVAPSMEHWVYTLASLQGQCVSV